ncbi:hypothetical protein [Klebsiella pneumoniae]|uniref:hypothetical protein n=1 Tax=Klebsiella pneumoniae TaxID=573 RepID=UPI0020191B6F|nr:hypothetical protein [Klebsiella pneumoniae]
MMKSDPMPHGYHRRHMQGCGSFGALKLYCAFMASVDNFLISTHAVLASIEIFFKGRTRLYNFQGFSYRGPMVPMPFKTHLASTNERDGSVSSDICRRNNARSMLTVATAPYRYPVSAIHDGNPSSATTAGMMHTAGRECYQSSLI